MLIVIVLIYWIAASANAADLTGLYQAECRLIPQRSRQDNIKAEEATKDRKKAVSYLEKSIASDPKLRDPYYHLGLLC